MKYRLTMPYWIGGIEIPKGTVVATDPEDEAKPVVMEDPDFFEQLPEDVEGCKHDGKLGVLGENVVSCDKCGRVIKRLTSKQRPSEWIEQRGVKFEKYSSYGAVEGLVRGILDFLDEQFEVAKSKDQA